MRYLLSIYGLLLLTTVACAAGPATSPAGKYTVTLTSRPAPPAVGDNLLVLTINDGGKPLTGAGVDVHLDMTTMPMPADAKVAPGATAGEYGAPVNFSMAGVWKIDVRVRQMASMDMKGDGVAHFLVETGRGITTLNDGAGRSWWGLVIVLLVAVVVGPLLLYRRHPRQRGYLVGMLSLLVVIAGTVLVVRKYRDPKTSTVLESAVMDMSAQPAPGAVAVVVERVRPAPFQASVGYTGAVLADQEEEVYPRVTGRLLEMPWYPGDRIAAGQIVARLDTTELAAKEAEARFGSLGATQGISAAGADLSTARAAYARALKGVDQAQAQQAQAQSAAHATEGTLKASQSEVTTARRQVEEAASAVIAAQSGIDQAQEAVSQAQSEVDSAEADFSYWTTDLVREKKLYADGAIARRELERETAQVAASQAKLNQAKAVVRTTQAGVTRARQDVIQAQARQGAAQAAVATAEARVEQAQAERDSARQKITETQVGVQTAQAEVRMADAGITGATAKAGVAQATARQAQAAWTEANTVRGYTTIRATTSGVVTARNLVPGTLVQPGMSILKIAKTDVVRIQVNVSEADLPRIRVGQLLTAHPVEHLTEQLAARISAIFPTQDAAAHTAVVEARLPNPDNRLRPGQYLAVTLDLNDAQPPALSVPTTALATRDKQTTLFTAVSDGLRVTAKQVAVRTARVNNDRTEILSGLHAGDRIITSGVTDLRDGDVVKVVQETNPPAPPARNNIAPPLPLPLTRAGRMPAAHNADRIASPLLPMKQAATTGKPTTDAKKWYHCPMHLDMESDKPGKCPKCGMDYVEFKKQSRL